MFQEIDRHFFGETCDITWCIWEYLRWCFLLQLPLHGQKSARGLKGSPWPGFGLAQCDLHSMGTVGRGGCGRMNKSFGQSAFSCCALGDRGPVLALAQSIATWPSWGWFRNIIYIYIIYILYEYMAASKNGGRRTNAWKMMIDDGISRYPYSQTTWQTHIP